MSAIKYVETGMVYRKHKPHLRSLHAYHPSSVLLSAQEMVVEISWGK